MTERRVQVAIVGGGPAGAATAIGLARAGLDVALFERSREPKWRACGVYSSPLTRAQLSALGIAADRLDGLVAHVPAMVIQTLGGATARLDYAAYGDACGVDRVRLDAELLERAAAAGARVITGATVRDVRPGDGARTEALLTVSMAAGAEPWQATLVVGADGPGSLVARAFGVQQDARWLRRAGLTFHLDVMDVAAAPDAPDVTPHDGRMVIGPGWYCGICPVPGGRVNVGIVVAERVLRRAIARGKRPIDVARQILGELPEPWSALASRDATDELAVALPLANRVSRRSGPGFVLVGDATGFIDPISGEGLHRALVSAELATRAIRAAFADGGSAVPTDGGSAVPSDGGQAALSSPHTLALLDYDRRLRARFRRKDLISWVLQGFLARPEVLGYAVRRLGSRDELRATFAAVMADIEPPERALQSRFLARVLRP